MRRPRIGFALGIALLGFSACDSGGGPGGKTGGTVGAGGRATGGTTSAGGTTSTGGGIGASGGTTGTGGATATGGTTGANGGTTGGATGASGGAIGTGGTTGASGGAIGTGSTTSTGGTTGTTSAGGSAGGTGGATGGFRTDAGADAATGGTGGSPDAGRDAAAARDVVGDTSVPLDVAADRPADVIAGNCTCLGKPAPVCTPTGHLTYTLARAASPTADQADAYNVITCAMDMAVAYYNCYANITGSVRVSYDTGVSTADGNINGSIRFGAGRGYMQCATAMHEIGHTQGIGTAAQWASHVSGGLFVGTNTAAQLQAINATLAKPLDTAIHADGMHFWPYGLNYESEATGTDILIGHCQIVVAIRKDLSLQP